MAATGQGSDPRARELALGSAGRKAGAMGHLPPNSPSRQLPTAPGGQAALPGPLAPQTWYPGPGTRLTCCSRASSRCLRGRRGSGSRCVAPWRPLQEASRPTLPPLCSVAREKPRPGDGRGTREHGPRRPGPPHVPHPQHSVTVVGSIRLSFLRQRPPPPRVSQSLTPRMKPSGPHPAVADLLAALRAASLGCAVPYHQI